MSPLVISILTSVGTAVLADLIGYARARQQWLSEPILYPTEPRFEWRLLLTRAAIGLISGTLAGLGIQQGAGGQASPIAQGVLP